MKNFYNINIYVKMPKVASPELVKFIQTFPRWEGYMIVGETFYKEDDSQLLKFLNAMYKNENEIITFELLKSIPITEEQKRSLYEIQDEIDRKIDKMERRKDRC